MDRNYNLVDAVRVLIKWKLPIIGFVLLASIGTVVTVLVMDNYYEAKALFYPTNPSRTDRQVLFSKQGSELASDFFGTKNDVNRFLSIANSAPVVDFIVNNYDLANHYGYDTSSTRYKRYKVTEEFRENYKAIKTEYGGIEITLEDTDPELAATMVNMIVEVVDKFNKQNIKGNKGQVLSMFGQTLEAKQKEVDALTDTLSVLKEQYAIKEVGAPSAEGAAYVVTGNDPKMAEVFKVLRSKQENAIRDLNEIKTLFDQSEAVSGEDVSSVYVVEKAYASEKKSRPKRTIICIASFLISSFLAIAGALLIDRLQALKQEVEHAG